MRNTVAFALCTILLIGWTGCQKYEQHRKTAGELRMERLQAQRLNPRGSLIGRWELIMSVPQNPSAPVTHEAGIYMQLNADSTWERVEHGVRTVGERFSNRYDSVKMAYEEHYYAFWAIRLYQSGRLIQKLPYYLTDTALVHSNSFTGLPGPSTWVWYLIERKEK